MSTQNLIEELQGWQEHYSDPADKNNYDFFTALIAAVDRLESAERERDALQEQVRALAAEKENARDVMLYAANNIAYAIFNLSDKKLSDLKRGLSDTTCPTDSALLAERELRSFAARIRAGEKP